ncbi:hypothetical protein BASA61_004475 [Batrachochytrium salamandrivorans]|nr:hypothetical protein BASA61_004475 [Batrachochytrium salamandrivorans]
MSAKAVSEYSGKHLLAHWLPKVVSPFPSDLAVSPSANATTSDVHMASLVFNIAGLIAAETTANAHSATGTTASTPSSAVGSTSASLQMEQAKSSFSAHVAAVFRAAETQHPWLLASNVRLVCKPDQLVKRRGKNGLLGINLDWPAVKEWITARAGQKIKIDHNTGYLHTFLVEPFCPHSQDTEFYICIQSVRDGDLIFFTHEGGVDVGDVDEKARKMLIPVVKNTLSAKDIVSTLLLDIPSSKHSTLVDFIGRLYAVYVELQFTYLEINPLVVLDPVGAAPSQIFYLDLAAKIDQTADFECGKKWSEGLRIAYASSSSSIVGPSIQFPAPFGREFTREEAYIADLDAKTGASLKLTVLNAAGRIWTMVAGGGASVVYSDAIVAHGFAHELANYGEYSGAPSESQTYEYAKTILDLMTRGAPHPDGKFLFIGGGIANFTNVVATFKGIIRALNEFQQRLLNHNVKIYVRRAGPNFQEGLRLMRTVGDTLGLDVHVFGPEMHVTGIVPLALKGDATGGVTAPTVGYGSGDESLLGMSQPADHAASVVTSSNHVTLPLTQTSSQTIGQALSAYAPFTNTSRAFIYGMQPRAVQGMLDFDFMCKREQPSVACMIYPFGGHHVQKFYWGTKETLLPVYTSISEATQRFPEVTIVINFASFRSVYESTQELLQFPNIKTIAIIAEGVPERRARQILWDAKEKGVLVIGPATVGGIKPGCFKIGNTGGMMDNIVSSKLYRAGCVAYVSKSGGMSNELNNIISRATDGVYEGVAIGGDRYPGSTFIDHMLRYEADPNVKILVLLGELAVLKNMTLHMPSKMFGHAGSFANSSMETAEFKNKALLAAGAVVPDTFENLPESLAKVYQSLLASRGVQPFVEPPVPKIPIDYAWAQELGLIRKPASFISTICDDRGQELLYAGMAISEVFKEEIGIGGVLSLLWFKRRLPPYAGKFIEMVLMLTADHGPAVSGAHNTIVTARAGKDLISSLVSGLLTIGERFGGALDGAAQLFSQAYDQGLSPQEFVDSMRKKHQLILGIGHKIKSRTNPDLRVSIVKEFVRDHFPTCDILNYAIEVEKITTSKKDNLILNVDGAVGVAFVDVLRSCGAFSRDESEEYIRIGTLNGLFVLGRSIGFIGHYLDQKRLKQGLYRHPWDDISYMTPEQEAVMLGGDLGGDIGGAVAGTGRTLAESGAVVARGVANA